MSKTRHLAAIMFTDIVGYTALMGEDEKKAFQLLEKNRWLQKSLIEEYGGKFIKELGDGVLASFTNVVDAVSCACMLIKGCKEIEGLQLRIGIHLGDVIFENNDVFGDSVNIASRLQALAPVGGIWISESVHKNITNKKGISSKFIREETLKNVKEPVQIYEVDIDSFQEDEPEDLIKTTVQVTEKKTRHKKRKLNYKKIFAWGVPVIALGSLSLFIVPPIIKKQSVRNKLIPEIQNLVDNNFANITPTRAFDLAKEAEKYIPRDSALLKLWPLVAQNISFETIPAGADLYWKDYNDLNGVWKHIGKTPLIDIWFPRGFPRVKIEKKGFKTIYSPTVRNLKLDSIGAYPEDMVKVVGSKSGMSIVGLEQHGGKNVSDFLMDMYEVINKDFKRFVDAGGYKEKKFWDYHFVSEDSELTWDHAMNLFLDKTGKPGPANWEVGTYPDGKENHPVTGISWYEAMAYAKFAGKKVPTVYHWSLVANTSNTWGIIPNSNFNGIGTVPVGTMQGISHWGVYDIAGNAREWCYNESDKKGQRFILGGGWNDPTYSYNDGYMQPALDRSLSNGFRCMKDLPGDSTFGKLLGKVELAFRDYTVEKPVNDETFNVFLRQYAYDHSPLKPDVKLVADSGLWKIEKIEIDAAYNQERVTAYLFLPKNFSSPYQTVVFYPGGGVIFERKFNYGPTMTRAFDFILKSGRAVLYPVLKGTFERGGELRSDLPEETKFYKDHVIFWVQDISRSLDYLNTRNDIVHDTFGYYGYSWGSRMGGVVCATEPRFKVAVYHVGGLKMQKTFPEADPLNFISRVKIPVLMLNGKNDTYFPVETSQKPMFKLLGTPEKDKKIIIYEGGHLVPKSELMKESLFWFDKYLGPVK